MEGVVCLPGDREADVQPLLDLAHLLVGGAGEEVLEEQLVLGDPGEGVTWLLSGFTRLN